MSDYSSNATLAQIAARLREASKIIIFTHAKPDGDAVGSTLALARALTALGKSAAPIYLPPWSTRFEALIGATPVIHERRGIWTDPALTSADACAVLDTGSWNQLADAKAFLVPRRASTVLVDHHPHGDADVADLRHIDTTSASACELVAELCRLLLSLASIRDLPRHVAEPLYLGLATDTGWFRYSNTRSATLRMAADLIDAGVDHNRLYRNTEQTDSPRRLMLTQRALASLEYLASDRAAMMCVTKRDIEECNATQDELGGLTDLPQAVGSVRAVAVLTEVESTLTKVSLRSKAPDPGQPLIDVNKIAQTLGGGGHVHAAGVKMHMPLAQAREHIRAALIGAFA
jgi:phosphoesterase RecJ-like protein